MFLNDRTPILSNRSKSYTPMSPPQMNFKGTPENYFKTTPHKMMALNKSAGKSSAVKTSSKKKINYNTTYTPISKSKGNMAKIKNENLLVSPSSGQSNQKWEDMFACLVKYVEDTREKETKGSSAEAKRAWEWCGNVPTTYKVSTCFHFVFFGPLLEIFKPISKTHFF